MVYNLNLLTRVKRNLLSTSYINTLIWSMSGYYKSVINYLSN